MPGLSFVRFSLLALGAALVPGCLLFFDDGGKSRCERLAELTAELSIAEQRNPHTLVCEAHGGPPTCVPGCGADCPTIDPAPAPTWGVCGDACEALGESACEAEPSCRVVKDAWCAIAGDCLTDFLGCFPVDMVPDDEVDCFAADAFACSRSAACTALHRDNSCLSPPCAREFVLCMPEGGTPGSCFEPAACRALPPPCRDGTTPGVANGCWTGACIPNDLCE